MHAWRRLRASGKRDTRLVSTSRARVNLVYVGSWGTLRTEVAWVYRLLRIVWICTVRGQC
jgi:hypothetical protein